RVTRQGILLAKEFNGRAAFDELFDYRNGRVARTSVGDENFFWHERLLEKSVEEIADRVFFVANGHHYADIDWGILDRHSVERELTAPVGGVFEFGLVALINQARFQHQVIHFSSHEATIAVFGRADNRLAADIEARVHDRRVGGAPVKCFNDVVVELIRFAS